MLTPEDKLALSKMIQADPHLTAKDKGALMQKVHSTEKEDTDVWDGIAGAGVAFAVSRFLKLSKNSQILLTIAGYGIGKYLLDNFKKHDNMIEYNDKTKIYKLNV